ncbi:hypothetical protein VN12_23505 [Pirellula sp. SH-Sr6A]|uniref:AAA family ATPase n=1 Tax=Pirellula sp. SH-Sr6A TaxID=1632865 RepID=UPI00078D5297|nr:AAA family ATPase [Pirellula sp. SH-Sr6A]AMV35113.1 hypothetical protein VN12_23505 [Pirellula sp. SH-Sr6A]
MSNFGFYLKQLTLRGAGLQDASIDFDDGLNVVTGPSDTGKTFISQCIDFMFGGSNPPEEIPEAEGYDEIFLSLVSRNDNRTHVLSRGRRGGAFALNSAGREEVILSATHDPNSENTISHFLLRLTGTAGKLIRTNARGKTRQVSFRDIARLVVIDEETVITRRSPILTGQFTTSTVEKGVFRLLLTGVDDSAIREEPNRQIAKQRESAKYEVIDKVRENLLSRIKSMGVEGTSDALRDQLAKSDTYLAELNTELSRSQQSATNLENSRRARWFELHRVESRIAVIEQLQARFVLLDEQYTSDLRLLETITEVGFRLDQLQENRCPVCGAPPEHHAADFHSDNATPATVATASRAEAERTRELKTDLVKTLNDNERELSSLRLNLISLRNSLSDIGKELDLEAKPRLQEIIQQIQESQERRAALLRVIELYEQLVELDELSDVEKSEVSTASHGAAPSVSVGEAEQFSQEVENLLREWKFPGLDRVVFSEVDQDVVISGRKRGGRGKGVRAITHSAFSIALANYCANRGMPHPSTLTIDSPLVVYREPDDDEGEFSTDVKDMFYRTLATSDLAVQVIILENDIPPDDVDAVANVIKFTGSSVGRRGFIPARQDELDTGV